MPFNFSSGGPMDMHNNTMNDIAGDLRVDQSSSNVTNNNQRSVDIGSITAGAGGGGGNGDSGAGNGGAGGSIGLNFNDAGAQSSGVERNAEPHTAIKLKDLKSGSGGKGGSGKEEGGAGGAGGSTHLNMLQDSSCDIGSVAAGDGGEGGQGNFRGGLGGSGGNTTLNQRDGSYQQPLLPSRPDHFHIGRVSTLRVLLLFGLICLYMVYIRFNSSI